MAERGSQQNGRKDWRVHVQHLTLLSPVKVPWFPVGGVLTGGVETGIACE